MSNDAVESLRSVFNSGVSRKLEWRLTKLEALRTMLTERTAEFTEALHQDLRKHPDEAWMTEIGFVCTEISHTVKNLRRWLEPERASVPVSLLPASAQIVNDPLGVVLVIAPWNYPVQLALVPVLGALAAGNTVLLKPSELAPATSAVLAEWLPKYLGDAVAVLEGGVPETTELLKERFDHIFYTGNGQVARIVMTAAAQHLTPVTLELGGKSPVYLDESVDLRAAAQRIAWGKYLNAGQTCVAPDYVLGTEKVLDRLAAILPKAINSLFRGDPRNSDDYGRIINERHFERLERLLEGAELVTGGECDATENYLAPTVLRAEAESPVMQQEIFGPLLPLVTVRDEQDAIRFINERDKPLALYVFTERKQSKQNFIENTSSGALCFGVPAAHLLVPGLPFGGVGPSGMGAYHGKHSLETFSHRKAVFDKPLKPDTMKLIYPPFNALKHQVVTKVIAPAG
ncbi:aldehyde dehydrogenase family protein [Psychromicrobium lacuslunae]|uniref:Aldehyde dehydrogenase n=1 Tax=Psychromicrobium lacuslunae TaxID=1618207 RepID=A0A0D4BYB2_9MICC|nr:aldehyde dehydrogenase family protein [Psychromicrobium lacuslunae]AJT41105.1 aldehyde dehydrogenase [Psychromicrobium lacuslunae]